MEEKVTLLRGCFSRFLNCANETKSRKELQISPVINLFHANFTPWKCQKNRGFLMFAGGVEMEHWREMGFLFIRDDITRKFNIPRLSNKIYFLKKPWYFGCTFQKPFWKVNPKYQFLIKN